MSDTIVPFIWFCVATIGVCFFGVLTSVGTLFLQKGITMGYIYIAIGIVAVFFVLIFLSSNKAKKREEAEKQEKIKMENEFSKKVKESPTVNNWADGISDFILRYLNEYPYESIEFHFKGYVKALEFGVNLQDIYLPNINDFISQDGKRSISSYNFCQYGLPDLNSSGNQIELFSIAVAELVSERIKKHGYFVEVGKLIRIVDNRGYKVEGCDECFGRIIYNPPKIQGSW